METGRLLVFVAFLLSALNEEGNTQQIDGCFISMDCTGPAIVDGPTDAESCCLADSPLSYSSGGSCTRCNVIGWQFNDIQLEEIGSQDVVMVGVVKGDALTRVVNLVVSDTPGTALRFTDYTPPPGSLLRLRPRAPPEIVTLSAQGDRVSQEGLETFTVILTVGAGSAIPAGYFFRSTLNAVIKDRTVVFIEWTELDYGAPESRGRMNGIVRPDIEIANPITVTIRPLTYQMVQDLGFPLPTNLPVACDVNDFDTTELEVLIPTSTGPINEVGVVVIVEDDLRDEVTDEGFLVLIELKDAMFPDLVQFDPVKRLTLARVLDNDDPSIGFELPAYTYPEEDTDSPQIIRLVKETVSDLTLSVQVSILAEAPAGINAAENNVDYRLVGSQTYSFPPETDSHDVSLTILADVRVEEIEGFVLSVSQTPGSGNTVLPGENPQTNVFITDSDEIVVGFEMIEYAVQEDVGTREVCVRVSQPPTGEFPDDVTFDIILDTNTGTAGLSDFTPVTQTLSFTNTALRRCVEIPITVDTIQELDEMFTVILSRSPPIPAFPPVRIDPGLATVTIEDDDAVEVEFDPTTYTVTEGDIATITIVLRGMTSQSISVDFATQDLTAVAPSDYTTVTRTVTFNPGETSLTVDVLTTSDQTAEETEQFQAVLRNPSAGATLGDDVATVDILDPTQVLVEFDPTSFSAQESSEEARFTIVKRTPTTKEVTVLFSTRDGSATVADGDYTMVQGFAVTFAPNEESKTVTVVLNDDQILENDEDLIGVLTLPGGSSGVVLGMDEAIATILDDDGVVVGFDPDTYSVTEGGVVTFEIVRSGQSSVPVSVDFSTEDGTANAPGDYTSTSMRLTFQPGVDRLTVPVQTTQDVIAEAIEMFRGRLMLPVGQPRVSLGVSEAIATITDDDEVVVEFDPTMYSVTEGMVAQLTIVLRSQSAVPVTVDIETVEGTANSPSDYTTVTRTVTFNPGDTSQTVDVPTASDQTAEETEQFTAVLRNPSAGAALGDDVATVDILDPTQVLVEFDPTSFSAQESSEEASFTIVKRTSTTREVTVLFSTRDGSATVADGDYTMVQGFAVTFAPNEDSKTVTVVLNDDQILENDEDLIGFLTLPGGSSGVVLGMDEATATILDDDGVVVGFDPDTYSVTEGGVVTFEIVRSGQSSIPVSVDFSTEDDTANAPGDYTSVSMRLTFQPGVDRLTVPVQTTQDVIAEAIEMFRGRLMLPVGQPRVSLGVSEAIATITDDDEVVVEFDPTMYSVTEGMMAQLTIVLRSQSAVPVTVDIETVDGTANSPSDYTTVTRTVTFNPGVTTQMVTVPTLSDTLAESTEQFTAVLRNPSAGAALGDEDTATVDITDTTDVVIEFDPISYTVTEGVDRIVRLTVVKRTPSTRQVTVLFSTESMSAEAPSDFMARTNIPVVFNPSDTQQIVEVTIANDVAYEGVETFGGLLTLPDGSSGVMVGADRATVTIDDDDMLTIGFEQEIYTTTEPSSGSSQQMICIAVTNGQLMETLTVQPEWTDGTAIEDTDYRAPTGNFILQPGTRPRSCLPLTLLSDNLLEAQEELTGRIVGIVDQDGQVDQTPNRITFDPQETTVLINDDPNEAITVGFEFETYTTSEPDGTVQRTLQICMEVISGSLGRDFYVVPRYVDGTATTGVPSQGGDYVAGLGDFVFTPAMTKPCLNIFIFDDSIVERTEQLTVEVQGLREEGGGTVLSSLPGVTVRPSSATVDIDDNDSLEVGFERDSYNFLEPNRGISQQAEEICVVIFEGDIAANSVLTVTPQWTPGTATANADYRAPVGNYVFRSGSRRECLDLIVLNDLELELPEDLTGLLQDVLIDGTSALALPQVTIRQEETLITIEDTDAVTVGFEFPAYTFPEPSASFQLRPVCMVLSGPVSFDLTVSVNWVPGSATPGFSGDYNPTSDLYRFNQGALRSCVDIQIFRDNSFEPDEDFFGQIQGFQLPSGMFEPTIQGVTVQPSETRVVIEDMDELTIGFVRDSYTFSEPPAGSSQELQPICIEVKSGMVGTPLIIEADWIEGTAFEGLQEDYLRPTNSYSLQPTQFMSCLNLVIRNDIFLEETESLQAELLRVTDLSGNVLVDRITLDPSNADIEITDNDFLEIGFEQPVYTAVEPTNIAQMTQEVCMIVFRGSVGRELVVVPEWVPGTATQGVPSQGGDYVPSLNNFVFAPGSLRACVDVFVFNDESFEVTEQFTGQVDGFLNADGAQVPSLNGVTVNPDQTRILILDQDRVTIGFVNERETFTEPTTGVSQSREMICVEVKDGRVGTPLIIVPVWTAGTATEGIGGDYIEPLPTQQYSLDTGDTEDCIELTILNDNLVEPTEDLTARLVSLVVNGDSLPSVPGVFLQPEQTTIEIEDNDEVTIGFAEPVYSVTESNTGSTTVSVCVEVIDGSLGRQLRIVPEWPGVTATEGVVSAGGDYSPEDGNFILNPGDIMSCIDILVHNDNLFEVLETFNGRLIGFINDGGLLVRSVMGVILNPAMTEIMILDSDEITVGFEEEQYSFSEPETGDGARREMICVVVSGSELTTQLRLQAIWNDVTAVEDTDYVTFLDQFTIEAGETRNCVPVDILEDQDVESLENFMGRIQGVVDPLGNVVPSPERVTINPRETDISIIDMNIATIGFEEVLYNVTEGDGFVDVVVLLRNGQLSRFIPVTVVTMSDTATEPEDYSAVSRVLTFLSPLSVRGTIRIPIEDDTIDDDGESFFVDLFIPPEDMDSVQLSPQRTVVRIIDNDVFCEDLPQLENGVITYSVQDSPRPSGTIANHVCNDGFILVGVEERTCLDSGNFSDSPPSCEPIVCDELEALENGRIEYAPDSTGPEYDLNTVATYICDEGFELVGDETRTCEDVGAGVVGEFSGTAATCEPIVCDELETLENGMIVYAPDSTGPEYDLNTVATYICDEGFELVGDENRTCEDVGAGVVGEFSGTAATCEPITCEDLPDIENGVITYSIVESPRPVDTLATYTCIDGFMLIGSAERTCLTSGNFSGMEPICSMIPVCQDLPELENGMIFYSTDESPRAVGTVATHRCNEGFILIGVENRTCQDDTEFSDSPPTCEPIVCNELEALENGRIEYAPDSTGPEYDLNTVATYICDEGFELVGDETRTCEDVGAGVVGEFSGTAATCEPIVCDELEVLENGRIVYAPDSTGPEYDLNTVATYICDEGFELVGDETRTCEDVGAGVVGEFSGTAATCEPIVCDELEALENGVIEYAPDSSGPEYDLNTVATYICDEGFELVGDETRTCEDVGAGVTGEFSGTSATCEPIVCDELEALENGMIVYAPDSTGPQYDLNTVATYICDEGFELVGDENRTCEDVGAGVSGEFSGTAATCEPITCEDLPDIENGDITYSIVESPRPVDTLVTYTCIDGFMLIGSAERTCLTSGNFSGMEPICSMIPVCQDLPELENGMIFYSTDESPRAVGTVATHRCNEGFILIGVENRTCQDDTEFSDSPPTCEPIVCDELEALENGRIEYAPDSTGPEYDLNTVATYICDEGFELVGDETRTCEDVGAGVVGEFSGTAATCEPIVCDELEVLENGRIVYAPDSTGPEYDLNTVATYICDEGFELVGDETRTCEDIGAGVVGEFSGTAATCEPIVCDELEALENGVIEYAPDSSGPEYDLNTVATYICDEGFELVGDETRTCEDVGAGVTGEFNGTPATCEPIVCNELETLENGMIVYAPDSTGPEYDLNTVATYICDEGFELVGDETRTCEDVGAGVSGEFNGTSATCEPIVCDELEALENGMIVYAPDSTGPQYDLNTVATYICDEGFELVGDENRTCEDVGAGVSGEFSGTAATCEPITCEDLPDIENGVITYSIVESPRPVDTLATYTCIDGFMLIGSAERTCLTNGNFSGIEPICSMIPVCQDLPELENGMIFYSTDESPRAVGTVATHRCNEGFILIGVENRTCQDDTEFSDSPPTCEPIVCDELETLENGMIVYAPDSTGPEYDLNTVATYICDEGFELVGDETRTCEDVGAGVSGEFSGTSATCEPIVCDELEALENGMIVYAPDSTGPEYDLNTVATYICNEGFELVGDETRTCEDVGAGVTGEFNGTAATCEPITCEDLPDIENGVITYSIVESPRPVDTLATYTCIDGFMLIGSAERTCLTSGNFSGIEPICSMIPVCQDLPELENGMIFYSTDESPRAVGTVATHRCNEGFILIGVENRTCQDDTEFSDSPPTCEPIVCDELEILENGMIVYAPDSTGPEYDLNTVATYICDEGFELVGDETRTCEDVGAGVSGEFSGTSATCEPIVCDELEALENGMIVYAPDSTGPEYDLNTVATYICNEGFELVGDETRTCEDVGAGVTGEFNGTAATCEPITCEDLPDIENGDITYSIVESPRPVDTLATYTCIDGFMLIGSAERTCLTSGNFSGMEPICSMIPVCQDLPELENGMIFYSTDESPRAVGTVATHRCNEGFILIGVENRTCQDDTEFSDSPPACEPIVCDELEALENGMIVYAPDSTGPEYDLNTVASYICDEGFELVGDENRTCEEVGAGVSGEFSGTAATCEPITCEDLPDIENGDITYSIVESPRPVDTLATYTCIDGFMLIGSAERTCLTSGNFSGMEPICSMIPVCQDLPELENGMIFYSTDESPRAVGTVATHRCNEGFILIGVENRTCQDDTEFSDSPPTCEPIVCDELETLENGVIEYAPDSTGPEYDLNTLATYICDEGFELVGDETRTCEDVRAGVSGEFSGTAATCEPITCEDLPNIENGDITYSIVESPRPVDTLATYTCIDGFMLIGSAERTCLTSGNFSGMEPICSMIPVCQDLPELENGIIFYSTDESPRAVGTVATHRCNEGFILIGVENRTCQDDTEFSDSPPTCEPIVCDELEALENGMIEYAPDNTGPEYDLNTVATYICSEGFELVGDETRTCEDVGAGVTGEFNGTAATCDPITCEDLPDIENGDITYSIVESPRPVDTLATYTCVDGFMLIGLVERTCLTSGNFSGMEPICSMIPVCQDLPELENGMIFYSTDESPRAVGTVATHRCNEGFILIGVENRTCQDDTEFSDSPPTCEPIVCDELETLENGVIEYAPDSTGPEYDLNTLATYICDEGFELVGDETRTCEDVGAGVFGEFSGTAATCEPITCEDLPDIENGDITYSIVESPRPVDTLATYTCIDGFMLIGSAERTCLTSGNFSGMEPICSMIPVCQDLPELENGMIFYSTDESPRVVGTVATHRCNEGFILIGVENRTCQDDTEFSDSPPTCELIVCDELEALENGMIEYAPDSTGPEYDLNTLATYTCDEGFVLVGDETRTCEDVGAGVSGEFSGTTATCEPIVCDELEALENGMIVYAPDSTGPEYDLNTVATYICDEGFVLSWSHRRICVDVGAGVSGEFNETAPTCDPIVCDELEALENGMIVYAPNSTGPEYDLNTVATYICNEGFELVGNETRTCEDAGAGVTGEFNGTAATCEPIVCDELEALENGMIVYAPDSTGPEYDLNTVATYLCDEGFELVGDETRTCEDAGAGVSGEFSGTAATCGLVTVTVMFVESEYTFFEDEEFGTFEVSRSGPTINSFEVVVIGGPSTQLNIVPSVMAINVTIEFPAGSNSSVVQVMFPITDDEIGLEDVERFRLTLVIPEGVVGVEVGDPGMAYINVVDDDVVMIELEDELISVSESEKTYMTCVIKDREILGPIEVEIKDIPGSAKEDTDYVSFSPTLKVVIPADSNRSCFTGEVIEDQVALEGTEDFVLQLQDPMTTGVLIGDNDQTVVEIIDTNVVTTTITQAGFRVQENVGLIVLCVTKDLETAIKFNVTLTSVDGSATNGEDFQVAEVLIVTLETTANTESCVNIEIKDDAIFEDAENFRVVLSTDSNDTRIQPGEITVSTVLIDDRVPEVPSVNDTIVGDPLLSVPLTNTNFDSLDLNVPEGPPSLCFEIHGEANEYFNLVTDDCVTVNARYNALNDYWNVINRIGVKAVDDEGKCREISVDLEGCAAAVDNVALTSSYSSAGIFVRPYRRHVRVSVPNCNGSSHLVMYVFCQQNLTVWDPFTDEPFQASMIKYVIAHGINLNENSHGLIGQFWNVPVEVSKFTGQINDTETNYERYEISVTHPDFKGVRRFTGLLLNVNWEFQKTPCFYVGNQQGGSIYEVEDPNDSVIEGGYEDYRVGGAFETEFKYNRFDDSRCTS